MTHKTSNIVVTPGLMAWINHSAGAESMQKKTNTGAQVLFRLCVLKRVQSGERHTTLTDLSLWK